MRFTRVHHQFSLFGFQKPKAKVKISAERIRQVQALINKGDGKGAVESLREIRYALENHLRKIK